MHLQRIYGRWLTTCFWRQAHHHDKQDDIGAVAEDLCMLLGVVHFQSQSQSYSQADCIFNGPICYVFSL